MMSPSCFPEETKTTEVAEQLAALAKLPIQELRVRWRKAYGTEPSARIPRDLLLRAAAYRIQESAYGGLGKKTLRALRTMARALETEGRLPSASGPILKTGAKLVREWHGKTYTVIVLDDGFEFAGKNYRSLSTIAQRITGAHWSGRRFFGLIRKGKSLPSPNGEPS